MNHLLKLFIEEPAGICFINAVPAGNGIDPITEICKTEIFVTFAADKISAVTP
jgi:hypothetical protein